MEILPQRSYSTERTEEATKPPPRYTEATLLAAMEGAGRLVEDEDMAQAMKEKGLGTPATRAATIEHLLKEEYIKEKVGIFILVKKLRIS